MPSMNSSIEIRRARPLWQLMAVALLVFTAGGAGAATGGGGLADRANNHTGNLASLQRGARNFVNYCMGCHSAQYVRYNQLARDLGMSEDQVVNNLMFAAIRPTETMGIAMRSADGERWFGVPPPDLSLITRARGVDYVYNFLRGFYADPSRPWGVNNIMLPNTSMPHVLWQLQGVQAANFREVGEGNSTHLEFSGFEEHVPGSLSAEEYDEFVRDTVNFLDYIGEPVRRDRYRLGLWVIAFLGLFGLFAWFLKQEIWKDIK